MRRRKHSMKSTSKTIPSWPFHLGIFKYNGLYLRWCCQLYESTFCSLNIISYIHTYIHTYSVFTFLHYFHPSTVPLPQLISSPPSCSPRRQTVAWWCTTLGIRILWLLSDDQSRLFTWLMSKWDFNPVTQSSPPPPPWLYLHVSSPDLEAFIIGNNKGQEPISSPSCQF